MKGVNLCVFAGNLTRTPELRFTQSGKAVTAFSLAINRSYTGGDGEKQEEVYFANCVAWGKAAEIICQYVGKGDPLLVQGRMVERKWEHEGQEHRKTECIIDQFNFLPKSEGNQGYESNKPANDTGEVEDFETEMDKTNAKSDPSQEVDIEDIPF